MSASAIPFDRSNWKRVRLGEVLQVCHGKCQHSIESKTGKYPILATSGEIGRTDSYLYDKPSVLIGRKGTIDKPQYIDIPFWTIDTLFYTKIAKDYNPKFLYYLCLTIDWASMNEASGVPSLSANRIESLEVAIPNVGEQDKIASVLSSIDKSISTQKSLITKYESIKKATVNLLLSSHSEIPLVKLSDVACFSTETIKTGEIDLNWYVGTENMLANCGGVTKNNTPIQYPRVRSYCQGDILVSNIRPYLKKIWCADRNGGCSTDVNVIRCKSSELLHKYLYFVLSQDCFFTHIMSNVVGTKMPRGDKVIIGDFRFPLPATREQKRIVHILKEQDRMICNAKYQLVKLENLKHGMMSYFFG